MAEHNQILLELLKSVGNKLIASEAILTELDSAIGDGDCGASIKKGFQAILEKLPDLNDAPVGKCLKQCGMALASTIGGVSGAIYATAFMRAGKHLGETTVLTLPEIHQALEVALEGVKERGEGTKVGDKTMVDSLEPAVEAFGLVAKDGGKIEDALEEALKAARKGSDSTIPLIAKKGRASYLGERSIGHRDAGSMVICFMFEVAYEYCKNKEN